MHDWRNKTYIDILKYSKINLLSYYFTTSELILAINNLAFLVLSIITTFAFSEYGAFVIIFIANVLHNIDGNRLSLTIFLVSTFLF